MEATSDRDNRSEAAQSVGRFQGTCARVAGIGTVVLLLLIPTCMVEGLIRERESRRGEVVREVSATWGAAQTVGGPIVTLPVDGRRRDTKGKATHDCFWHVLPTTLQVESTVEPQVRRRGLFAVPLYRTRVHLAGRFAPWSKAGAPDASLVRWDAAQISLPLGDTRGLVERVVLTWDGGTAELGSDALEGSATEAGLRTPLTGLTRERWQQGFAFRADVVLQGSEQLRFLPLGESTRVRLKSGWTSPSFIGGFLPFERVVAADGFEATWEIPSLARGFPQQWTGGGGASRWERAAFGARFVVPADHYQQSSRALKYAVLFLLLTFTTFFLFELLLRARIHPMNYLLVGAALCLFYLLLVALSERIPFAAAYWVSALATIGVIAAYAVAVVGHRVAVVGLVGVLGALYGYLYILLQLEEASLLLGAVALFLVLATVMYLTRKVDWFNLGTNPFARVRADSQAPAAPRSTP